jgi:hypothetical protein
MDRQFPVACLCWHKSEQIQYRTHSASPPINPQVGVNGLERPAKVCKGRVYTDIDLSRQRFSFRGPLPCNRIFSRGFHQIDTP